MSYETRLGVGLGVLFAAVSVGGNVLRGDRHLVSVFPGLFTIVIVMAGLFAALTIPQWEDRRRSNRRTINVAALVFAVLLQGFAFVWLNEASRVPFVLPFAGAFLVIVLTGYFFVYAQRG